MERVEAEAIYDAGRDACVELLVELSARHERQIARLEARVERLEERLRQSSSNSSKPPSAESPGARPRRGSPSGRKPGGQPGHGGTTRQLVAEGEGAGAAHRHQVFELPPIAVAVSEHRAHAVSCPGCGAHIRAALPADVAASVFGPRLQAAIALLSVRNRVSRRDVSELSAELFGCPVSVGSVDAICQRTSGALAAP